MTFGSAAKFTLRCHSRCLNKLNLCHFVLHTCTKLVGNCVKIVVIDIFIPAQLESLTSCALSVPIRMYTCSDKLKAGTCYRDPRTCKKFNYLPLPIGYAAFASANSKPTKRRIEILRLGYQRADECGETGRH